MTSRDHRCKSCHGKGGHIERDARGEIVIPCSDCLQRGICPRCASVATRGPLYPLESWSCVVCGWVVDVGRMTTRDADDERAIAEDYLRRIRAKLRRGEDENS